MSRHIANLFCPYCHKVAELVTGDRVYPHRKDLHSAHFWACLPCEAWVGTHKNSKHHAPLGRIANAELRRLKMETHSAFDPLWKNKVINEGVPKHIARSEAYQWLADSLGIEKNRCHIGEFDERMCRRAIRACKCRGKL